ncbi:MAG: XRE family transcriptional regulator [Rikenellaceae bacterium]|nr:XRE family transcriptional regulator [Rikenellaceae bacterium]
MTENLGIKIKNLRTEAGITREELARAAGTDSGRIELIENGKANPSISVSIKIARRLGVRLGTLLDGAESTSPVVHDLRKLIPTVNTSHGNDPAHLDFHSLAGAKSDRNMEPFYISVGYTEDKRQNYSTHEGEEFIFVLEGTIKVRYGAVEHILTRGQSIYYDSIVPHLVTTHEEDSNAKVLAVTYTPC